jgi:hypothetical protein
MASSDRISQQFPLHPLEEAERLGIRAIDVRAAMLALQVRAVVGEVIS